MINGTLSEAEKDYLIQALDLAWSYDLDYYIDEKDLLDAAKMQDMIRSILSLTYGDESMRNFNEEALEELQNRKEWHASVSEVR